VFYRACRSAVGHIYCNWRYVNNLLTYWHYLNPDMPWQNQRNGKWLIACMHRSSRTPKLWIVWSLQKQASWLIWNALLDSIDRFVNICFFDKLLQKAWHCREVAMSSETVLLQVVVTRVFNCIYWPDCGDSAWERIAIETVTPQQINSFYCTKPNDSRRQFDDFPLSSVSCTELLPLIHLYSKIDIRPTDAAIATQRSPLV